MVVILHGSQEHVVQMWRKTDFFISIPNIRLLSILTNALIKSNRHILNCLVSGSGTSSLFHKKVQNPDTILLSLLRSVF